MAASTPIGREYITPRACIRCCIRDGAAADASLFVSSLFVAPAHLCCVPLILPASSFPHRSGGQCTNRIPRRRIFGRSIGGQCITWAPYELHCGSTQRCIANCR
jgi:hypothetical protein